MSEIKKKRAPKDHVTDAHGNFILKEEAIKVDNKYYHKNDVVEIDGQYYINDNSIVKCHLTGKTLKIGVNAFSVFNHKFEVIYISDKFLRIMTFPSIRISKTALTAILAEKGIEFNTFYQTNRHLVNPCIKKGEYVLDYLRVHSTIIKATETYGGTVTIRNRIDNTINHDLFNMLMLNNDEILKAGFLPFFSGKDNIEFIHKIDAEFCKLLPRELYIKGWNYLGGGSSSNYQFHNIPSSIIKGMSYDTKLDLSNMKKSYGIQSASNFRTGGLPYTFGVEIETAAGSIKSLSQDLNCSAVRDGSVSGGEYVTGVLKGDNGVKQLKKICDRLYYNTIVDHRCGVHVHIGGLNLNKEFFIYAHLLGLKLQDNIFDKFLPTDRKNNTYCKKYSIATINDKTVRNGYLKLHDAIAKRVSGDELEKVGNIFNTILANDFENIYNKYSKEDYQMYIDEMYKILYMLLAQGKKLSSDNNKNFQHPGGRYAGGSNNSINYRYYWLNFISAAFNQRDNKDAYTIEFRCFGATTNFYSIYAWLLICMAFCSYVENNKSDIVNKKKITIKEILESVYGKAKNTALISALCDYVDYRESKHFNSELDTFPTRSIATGVENATEYKIIESALKSDVESDEFKYNLANNPAISQLINFFHLNLKK